MSGNDFDASALIRMLEQRLIRQKASVLQTEKELSAAYCLVKQTDVVQAAKR